MDFGFNNSGFDFGFDLDLDSNPYGGRRRKEERIQDLIAELAPVPEFEGETKQGVLDWAGQQSLGAVAGFGNALDLLGSSVRDTLGTVTTGEWHNPFDQWMPSNWFNPNKRLTGRELGNKWGWWSQNDPDQWEGADFGGFGLEIATDPLTYATFGSLPFLKGMGALSKSGQHISKLGLLDEAADIASKKLGRKVGTHEARHIVTPKDYIDQLDMLKQKYPEAVDGLSSMPRGLMGQRLGGGMNIDIPFMGRVGTLSPTLGYGSRALDKVNDVIGKSYPGRMWSKTFDWSARNWGGAMEQSIARRLSRYADNKRNYAAKGLHNYHDTFQQSQKAFRDSFGSEIARRQAGQAPLGRFNVGDVVENADLPGQGRVIGSEQNSLLVSVLDRNTNKFVTHRVNPKTSNRVGKRGSKIANAHQDLLINKAHDAVWRLSTELHNRDLGVSGLTRGLKEFQMGDVVDEFGAQAIDIASLPASKSKNLHKVFDESIDALEELVGYNYTDNVNKGLRIGEIKAEIVNGRPEGIRHVPRYVNRDAIDRLNESARTGNINRSEGVFRNPMEEVRNAKDFGATTGVGTSRGRTAATSKIPTAVLNRLYRDGNIKDLASVEEVAAFIKNSPDYNKYLLQGWNPQAASVFDSISEHATALAENVLRHRGDSIYSGRMLDDLMRHNDELTRSSATLDAVHETLAQDIVASGSRQAQPGDVPLHQVLNNAGMDVNQSGNMFSGKALEHLSDVLGRGKSPAELDMLARQAVTPEVAKAIQATKVIRQPSEELSAFLKAWDSFTSIFKSNVTLPFASFFMRNGMSGQFVNLTSGDIQSVADIARYTDAFRIAERLSKGSPKDRALLREIDSVGFVGGRTHFDDVEAIGRHVDPNDLFNPAPIVRAGTMPLSLLNPMGKIWKGARAEAKEHVLSNPSMYKSLFGIEQVAGSTPGVVSRMLKPGRTFHRAWLGKGSSINASVEWMNRVPMYLYLKNKGYSPSAAARRVRELQFDYSELSKAEKAVAKRVMPFYTFQRKMGPLFFKTLLERPGGALGTFIKASAKGTGESDVILPEYVTQNLAIPLATPEGGGWSGLTGFGLAHESPMAYFADLSALGRGDIGEFARGAYRHGMSQLNPLMKTPKEILEDASYFRKGPGGRGQRLSEMDPVLGRTISNIAASLDHWGWVDSPGGRLRPAYDWGAELGGLVGARDFGSAMGDLGEAVISGSPFTRYLHFTKGAFDPRPGKTGLMKALNAITGVRATNLTEQQLDAVGRDTMSEVLGASSFGRVFHQPYVDRKALIKYLAEGKITREEFNMYLASQSYFNHLRDKGKAASAQDTEAMANMKRYRNLINESGI